MNKFIILLGFLAFLSCEIVPPVTSNSCNNFTVSTSPVCGSGLCGCQLSYLTLDLGSSINLNNNNLVSFMLIHNGAVLFNNNLQAIAQSYSGQLSVQQPYFVNWGYSTNEFEFRGLGNIVSSNNTTPYTIQIEYLDNNGVQQICVSPSFRIDAVNGIDISKIDLFYHSNPISLNPSDFQKFKTDVFYTNDKITLYEFGGQSDIVDYSLSLRELDSNGNVIATQNSQAFFYPPADNNINIKALFGITPNLMSSRLYELVINANDCNGQQHQIIRAFRLDYRVRSAIPDKQ